MFVTAACAPRKEWPGDYGVKSPQIIAGVMGERLREIDAGIMHQRVDRSEFSLGDFDDPPAFQNRSSRGPRPGKPLRLSPHLSSSSNSVWSAIKLGPLTCQCACLAWCMRSMLSASRALRISMTSARVCAGRSCFVWYIWASPFPSIRLTFVWDPHDLAGLERLAHVCGTRALLHPYGMTGNTTGWRALMLV